MIVEWSDKALDDLTSISEYVGVRDRAAAARLVSRIVVLIETLLARHPAMGRPGHKSGTRELVITDTPYVAVYRADRGAIEIIRVFHSSQDWRSSL